MLHLHLVSLPVLIKCLDLRLVPDLDLDNNKCLVNKNRTDIINRDIIVCHCFCNHFDLIICSQDPLVRELIESGYIFVLPERDRHGRRVVFSVARKLDPAKHNTSHVVRAHIATFEVRKNTLYL